MRVRLTGNVPMADEEFVTLQEHAGRNAAVAVAALLIMLWLAVRSMRAMLAIVVSLVVGLALTAAVGLAIYGALNLISVAFAVLFVGLGVDFGIQYAVSLPRPCARRGDSGSPALRRAAREVGVSLALAAVAIAAGFFAFEPTDYRGVSELGVIAGIGMVFAFVASITLLPALLKLLRVGGLGRRPGFRRARSPSIASWPPIVVRVLIGRGAARRRQPRAAAVRALRFQPAEPAQPDQRGGRDDPGPVARSADDAEHDRRARAVARRGDGGRGEALGAAGGRAGADARELRPDRPAGEARADLATRRRCSIPR